MTIAALLLLSALAAVALRCQQKQINQLSNELAQHRIDHTNREMDLNGLPLKVVQAEIPQY